MHNTTVHVLHHRRRVHLWPGKGTMVATKWYAVNISMMMAFVVMQLVIVGSYIIVHV